MEVEREWSLGGVVMVDELGFCDFYLGLDR